MFSHFFFFRFVMFQTKNSTALLMCLRTGSLQILDQITATDVIPLTPHVRLTRYRQKDSNDNIYLNPSR